MSVVRHTVALFLALGSVSACALVMSFDYDTSSSPEDAGADVDFPEAAEAAPDVLADAPIDASTSRYRAVVLEDGPLAYWRMGVTSGSMIPEEVDGSNPLFLQGSAYELGVDGGIVGDDDLAIDFDGYSGHAVALESRAFDFPSGAPFTLECWAQRRVRPDGGLGTRFQPLIGNATFTTFRHGYLLYLAVGPGTGGLPRSVFEYSDMDSSTSVTGTGLADPGVWRHYVAVYSGTHASIYVDGSFQSSVPVKNILLTRTSKLTVALDPDAVEGSSFVGAIDEVAVYSKALPLDRIVRHHDVGIGNAP